jgi:hypothetical protein
MFKALWRKLRKASSVLPRDKCPRRGRPLGYRPELEPLEGRALPAILSGGLFALPPMPGPVSVPQQVGSPLPGATDPVRVTVPQGAPETVIDLGAVFGAVQGIQHGDGLRLSLLGNTNAGLVRTDLSEASLTLSYTRGQFGTATITVGATDADGVSVRQTLLVTVVPLSPASAPFPAPLQLFAPPGTSP